MSQSVQLPSDRSFGFTFVVVFLLVAAWAAWSGRYIAGGVFAASAVGVLAVTLLCAAVLRPFNKAWMKLGLALGTIVNPIVLGAMYFLLLAPIGFVMRAAGRDALRRRLEPDARTYWIERTPPGPAPDSLPHQF